MPGAEDARTVLQELPASPRQARAPADRRARRAGGARRRAFPGRCGDRRQAAGRYKASSIAWWLPMSEDEAPTAADSTRGHHPGLLPLRPLQVGPRRRRAARSRAREAADRDRWRARGAKWPRRWRSHEWPARPRTAPASSSSSPRTWSTPSAPCRAGGRARGHPRLAHLEVLGREEISERRMGGLEAVSRRDRRAAEADRRCATGRRADGETLGLVGKGVTFDTGGISIKPSRPCRR